MLRIVYFSNSGMNIVSLGYKILIPTCLFLSLYVLYVLQAKNVRSVKNQRNNHRLCVLVPHRGRLAELQEFLPHMEKFLNNQKVDHQFYIINQADNYRFNRGALLNVGFLESNKTCNYFALHDVDLLPLNPRLDYGYPSTGAYHVAPPHLHPKYKYKTFLGGILLVSASIYMEINGSATTFWGWGGEDDVIYQRITEKHFTIERPGDIGTGREDSFVHLHVKFPHPRDPITTNLNERAEQIREAKTGLRDTQYVIMVKSNVTFSGVTATVISVRLICPEDLMSKCVQNCSAMV